MAPQKLQRINGVMMVQVIDSTLREGVQAPGVCLGERASVEIARSLVSIGIDMVECGHPYMNEGEAARVRRVVESCGTVPVLSHARARREDIEAVKAVGAPWVGIFLGVNETSQRHRLSPGVEPLRLVSESVRHAKSLGLRVRFTVEDASRTPRDELVSAYRSALDAGADRICFADTVGALCPWEVENTVRGLCRQFPDHDLEVHFHDDRGFGDANALCAARAGAAWISSSVNGIGERCGITDTLALLVNLHAQGWRTLENGELLPSVSRLVASHSRLASDRRRPFVGHNAFTHVAKLHKRAAQRAPGAYCWIPPESVGRTASFNSDRLPADLAGLINRPEVRSATELRHHRHGPGDRYLMLDDRVVQDARQYCIVRDIPLMDDYGPGHVDVHRHCVDSLFLFIGRKPRLTGLVVEVRLADRCFVVESPCSVFIPSGVEHSYRVVSGTGLFVNHVLAGDYNSSLLDDTNSSTAAPAGIADGVSSPDPLPEEAMDVLISFTRTRIPEATVTPRTDLASVFDSLTFIDFFMYLEEVSRGSVFLDDVLAAKTFGEVSQLLAKVTLEAAPAP